MNILAFFAHPDDETMIAGGTLALLAQQGAKVHYVCATRGEGGEAGEPPLCSVDELGVLRAQEMACAVEKLGGASLTFLDYIDPRVGPENQLYPFTTEFDELVQRVQEKVMALQADVVITHGSNGEYGHPAHVICHQAVEAAIKNLTCLDQSAVADLSGFEPPLFFTVSANFEGHPNPRLANQDDPAHFVLDISPAQAAKTQAALCHRTQHALFVRRRSKMWGRQVTVPEVILSVEGLHRQWPVVNGAVEDDFADLLKPFAIQRFNSAVG